MKINQHILPLTLALTVLLGYNFMSANWNPPTGTAPTNNAPAPINVSASSQLKMGALGTGPLSITGNVAVTSAGPSILMNDNDSGQKAFWARVNNNTFFISTDRNGDTSNWENPSPLSIVANSSEDYATFANQVRATEFCNRTGDDCFEPSSLTENKGVNFETDGTFSVNNLTPGITYLFFFSGLATDNGGGSLATCSNPNTIVAQTAFNRVTGRTTQESHIIAYKVPSGVNCVRAYTGGADKRDASYVVAMEARGVLPTPTYSWVSEVTGGCYSWECSSSGVQAINVYCMNNLTRGAVADSRCTGTKPPTSQSCTAWVGSSCR